MPQARPAGKFWERVTDALIQACGRPDQQRPVPVEDALREEPPGRDAAFRRTILEIYDYRCAACGIRVKLHEDLSLVEAAHLIPFGVSRNDKP